MTTRKTRITQLKEFIEKNPKIWNNVITRRQIMERFALEWGLKTDTVVDYVKQIDAVHFRIYTELSKEK